MREGFELSDHKAGKMAEDKLQFAPVVEGLEEIKVVSGEEEEDTVFKQRARLFRYARENDPPMWK